MKVEVLVATMNQYDKSLIEKMNLRTDAIIINQCDNNMYEEFRFKDKNIKFLSNNQRGLSKSRNQALLYASGDICLIADDDIRYVDNYEEIVIDAFKKVPNADVIIFNTNMINYKGKIKRNDTEKIRKAPKYKNYGSVRIAFKRDVFLKNNIWFNVFFGAGGMFGSGEETLVIRELNRKGLKIYEYPMIIADVDYSTSTWFEGYNDKYFYNKGAFLCAAYPKLKNIFKFYYLIRFKKLTNLKYSEVLFNINNGIKGYRNLIQFKD